MNSQEIFSKLQNRKIYVLSDLIEQLIKLDPDTKLNSVDSDLGGYDVSCKNHLVIKHNKKNNSIYFGHDECFAYYLQEKQLIDYSQFTKISDSEHAPDMEYDNEEQINDLRS